MPACYGITLMLGYEAGALQLALLSATNELGLGGTGMGLPVTAQFISMSVMPLLVGPVADRAGKKKVIFAFLVVFVAGCLLTWLCASAAQLLIGVFIIGAGFSVCECMTTAAISDAYVESGEKYINLAQSFFCVGAVGSPILLQALMDGLSASWRAGFVISAIAMAALLPVLLFSRFTAFARVEGADAQPRQKSPFLIIGFVVCIFIYAGVESGIAYFADTVFTLGLDKPVLGAFAISLFWGFMGIGRVLFGRMKKIPPRATAVSLFFAAAVVLAMMFCGQETIMLGLYAASGLALACVWPGIAHASVAIDRGASGKIMSYLNLGSGLGASLIPLAIGAIINTTGISIAFLVLALISVASAFYMFANTKNGLRSPG